MVKIGNMSFEDWEKMARFLYSRSCYDKDSYLGRIWVESIRRNNGQWTIDFSADLEDNPLDQAFPSGLIFSSAEQAMEYVDRFLDKMSALFVFI